MIQRIVEARHVAPTLKVGHPRADQEWLESLPESSTPAYHENARPCGQLLLRDVLLNVQS